MKQSDQSDQAKQSNQAEQSGRAKQSDLVYRPITQASELKAAVELQKKVWATDTVTSLHQMASAILNGGSVIGAFDQDQNQNQDQEALVGFNYAFIGYDGHEAYLASHMMAIHPGYRDRGVGMQLKLEQRAWAMRHGYRKIIWTYDPFEARNGYLNLTKLGGSVSRFLPAFYGKDGDGLPIDRFMVEWELGSSRVEQALNGQTAHPADIQLYPSLFNVRVSEEQIVGLQAIPKPSFSPTKASRCLVPVPHLAKQLRQEQPGLFAEWHDQLRKHIPEALSCGFRVVQLVRTAGPIHYYVLEAER